MSRNVILPLLGLIGIVFFSLNRLNRPPELEPGGFAEPVVLEADWETETEPTRALAATPPPAPKLQSEVEADPPIEASAPVLEAEPDSTAPADSTAAVALEDNETDD